MITVSPWLVELANEFSRHRYQFFIVGGAIRNILLGKSVKEWDCTTDAEPSQVEGLLKKFGCTNINLIGKRFGTIGASYHNQPIEVTTYRGEAYQESSRHPEVIFGKTIEEDLSRRDFTVNAVAYNPLDSTLLDPHQGQRDIEHGVIQTVGRPQERFKEDPLRILRAIRFMTELNFLISPETLEAIRAMKDELSHLSPERISQEIDKVLLSGKPSTGIRATVETGMIVHILPELLPAINLDFDPSEHKDIYGHILTVLDQTPPRLALRWCALLHDIAKPLTRKKIDGQYFFLGHEVVGAKMAKTILRRLRYSTEFIDYVSKLVYLHQRLPNYNGDWTDGGIRRFVRDAGETLTDLFDFAQADTSGSNEKKIQLYSQRRKELQTRIEELEEEKKIALIKSPLDGDELMKLFHRQAGPWIAPIKEHLLGLVLDGSLQESDKETAIKIAKELVKKKG